MMRIVLLIFLSVVLSGCSIFCSSEGEEVLFDDGTIVAVDIPFDTNEVASVVTTNVVATNVLSRTISVIDHPSSNFDKRTLPISMIVIHYTAGGFRESLRTLCNEKGKHRVSAHYLVAENGTIYRLVDESKRAWHAGRSYWRGITDVNSASIGIEIVNLGHDKKGKAVPYPKEQIDAVINLCLDIQARHKIIDVVGHSDVAPTRKIDPGELFPWKKLYDCGVNVTTKGIKPTAFVSR